jgi:hypothetical protein
MRMGMIERLREAAAHSPDAALLTEAARMIESLEAGNRVLRHKLDCVLADNWRGSMEPHEKTDISENDA